MGENQERVQFTQSYFDGDGDGGGDDNNNSSSHSCILIYFKIHNLMGAILR